MGLPFAPRFLILGSACSFGLIKPINLAKSVLIIVLLAPVSNKSSDSKPLTTVLTYAAPLSVPCISCTPIPSGGIPR